MQIQYFCNLGWVMFYERNIWIPSKKVVTCRSNGEWSERSPVCDIPTRLTNLVSSSEAEKRELILVDRDMNTCFGPQNGTEEILQYSLDGELTPYAALICFTKGRGRLKIIFSPTENFTHDTSTDKWCMHPLQTTSVPNGQLEVSRIKAVLHCKEGFREKEDREVYATCENNTWSYLSLECVEDKPQMDHKTLACPPPDFPEGGRYEPERAEYEVGQKIAYSCTNNGLFFVDGNIQIRQNLESACELNGKWSQVTPFCDPPTKLNNPIAAVVRGVIDYDVIDGDINTCYYINETKMIMAFSLDSKKLVYFGKFCFRNGRATVTINMYGYKQYRYNLESEKWCEVPPDTVPNGQLEVDRSKAVLHCNKGFREKEGRAVYATCENKTWSYLSLQCTDTEDTPQKDYNTSGIVAGILIGLMILVLFGVMIFLIRTKKIRGICALYKLNSRNSNSTLPVGCNSTGLSRPENTSV
ncbi:unnamed protein product [Larinioides sclopetarius]|uniref:Sushi domain-containing protein n=1 Tax=Larinioides sclopetarius TaxID=280406 RepID=A0AAV2B2E4_9ARAC